ncbi:hypothetical protein [Qipengyuania sp. JC766]|uniref:hypothetical protein n=1 Tax=Qipengyuania sp. JC766 TaxID=3232139 RepID=UPI0034597634
MLAELGRREPKIFLEFLQSSGLGNLPSHLREQILAGKAQFEVERAYVSGRRADLAILTRGQERILVEVKEDDHRSEKNVMQTQDYIAWLKSESDRFFVHFSRYIPEQTLQVLESEKHPRSFDLRFRDLHKTTRDLVDQPLSAMIADYLEEIGVTSYRRIPLEDDGRALTLMAVQIAGIHSRGMGRLQNAYTTLRAPRLLAELVENALELGSWFHEANLENCSQKPTSRYWVTRYCDRDKMIRQLQRSSNDDDELPSSAISSANIFIYFLASLKKMKGDGWSRVEAGYVVEIDPEETENAFIRLYVSLNWQGDFTYLESDPLVEFPSEEFATKTLRKLMSSAQKEASKKGSPIILTEFAIPEIRR